MQYGLLVQRESDIPEIALDPALPGVEVGVAVSGGPDNVEEVVDGVIEMRLENGTELGMEDELEELVVDVKSVESCEDNVSWEDVAA